MLSYWFWPHPGGLSYGDPRVLTLLAVCLLMIAASLVISLWRRRQENPVTRRLSRSWPRTLRWFGGAGIVLTVSRVEEIQFLAMRALWVVWGLTLTACVLFQVWRFRRRHYTVVKGRKEEDPRAKYLPKVRNLF